MSTHPSAEQLSAFLDQELPDSARLPLEEHLRTCDVCAAHLAELSAVDEAARTLPLEEPAGYFDDFAARVRARVDTRRPRRTLPVWSWAAAAALLLAVVTPLALRERAAQAPEATAVREGASAPAAPALPPADAQPQAPLPAAEESKEADRTLPDARRQNETGLQERLQRRDAATGGALKQRSQDKLEQAPAAASAPVLATAPPARPEEKAADEAQALDWARPAPPAASQRQHGPRSQQYVPPPPRTAESIPADELAASSPGVADGAPGGRREAELAKDKDDGSARAKRSAASDAGGAAAGAGAEARLGATASLAKPMTAQTGDDARRRREAFRKMVGERQDDASADAERVGVIEEGVRAFRLEGRAEDRAIAERDGRAYLARRDALQATRVRALLKTLSEPRP